MGQICSTGDEPLRPGAFAGTTSSSDPTSSSSFNAHQQHSTQHNHTHHPPQTAESTSSHHPPFNVGDGINNEPSQSADRTNIASTADMEERLSRYRKEQAELARREAIVNAASGSMVPVTTSPSPHHQQDRNYQFNNHQNHHQHQQQRGPSNAYYDPSFAASAAQDILRSAAMTGWMMLDVNDVATREAWDVMPMGTMPRSSSSSSSVAVGGSDNKGSGSNGKTMEMLSAGRWDGIRLVAGGGGGGGASSRRMSLRSGVGGGGGGGIGGIGIGMGGGGKGGIGIGGGGGGDRPEYYLDDLAESFLESMVPTRTALFGGCPSIVENLP